MYPQTFEAACAITGDNPADERFATGAPDEVAFKKLKVITDAVNRVDNGGQPWQPDFDNYQERKWRPWFDLEKEERSPSGFRFILSHCVLTITYAPVGLCYKTADGSGHSAESFLQDWKAFITGN